MIIYLLSTNVEGCNFANSSWFTFFFFFWQSLHWWATKLIYRDRPLFDYQAVSGGKLKSLHIQLVIESWHTRCRGQSTKWLLLGKKTHSERGLKKLGTVEPCLDRLPEIAHVQHKNWAALTAQERINQCIWQCYKQINTKKKEEKLGFQESFWSTLWI